MDPLLESSSALYLSLSLQEPLRVAATMSTHRPIWCAHPTMRTRHDAARRHAPPRPNPPGLRPRKGDPPQGALFW